MTDAPDKPPLPAAREPQPEFGPALKALHPRWQKAALAVFMTGGNRTAALRAAGYGATPNALNVLASRMFADPRMKAAVREIALQTIDTSEPELLNVVFGIMRDVATRPADRLAAARIIWERARPVETKHKIQVEHTVTDAEMEIEHYRALQRLGAPREAFIQRFGANGLARVETMVAAEEAKLKQIEAPADVVDADFDEVTDER